MLFGDMVNVFIALALAFATMGLIVSAVTEAISSLLKWRSKTLLAGLKELLNDDKLTGLAHAVINHGAANPLSSGDSKPGTPPPRKSRPSYIDPDQFAAALVDSILGNAPPPSTGQLPPIAQVIAKGAQLVGSAPKAFANLGTAIDGIPDQQLRTLFQGMFARVNGDVTKFQDEASAWFDAAMDRLSGVYKRRTQMVSFVIALAIAVILNIDTIHIARATWQHPAAIQGLEHLDPKSTPADTLKALDANSFPFGWTEIGNAEPSDFLTWATRVVGWFLAAFAALLGAPFWFDTLQTFVQLGGSGPKPNGTKNSGGTKS